MTQSRRNRFGIAFLLMVIVGLGAVFAWTFGQISLERGGIAIDWTFRIYEALRGGQLDYQPILGPHHPPWSMLPLIPLGLLSPMASWGVLIYAYILVLTFSVPYQRPVWRSALAVALLLVSHPSIRANVDGNLELLGLTGCLILFAGYSRRSPLIVAIGVLLASAKPQVGTLLILIVGLYMLRTWPRREWLKAVAITAPVVLLSFMWRGQSWLAEGLSPGHNGWVGSFVLVQSLSPLPATLIWLLTAGISFYVIARSSTGLTREKAGLIIATNLFLGPFGSVNSLLSVLAVGIIPLFMKRFWPGLLVIALMLLPNIIRLAWAVDSALPADPQIVFWNIALFLTWAVLALHVYLSTPQAD